ncbi:MAG: tyrosine-type recombinase/integrase [Lachnospiraceae bacterium]|nr:tyrosine-type recombinase/integrase [Lachnospiraceae bacterium]
MSEEDGRQKDKIQMTMEILEEFLESLRQKGRGKGSLQSYQTILIGLYEYLPEDKLLRAGTGQEWREWMEDQDLSPRTVSTKMSAWNSFVQFLGRREWQVINVNRSYTEVQPELTRSEYLRLLRTAREMDNKKSYLLIKVMGGAGVRIQELAQLTVENVKRGTIQLESHNSKQKRILRIPPVLKKELLAYTQSEQIETGPVFVTRKGEPLPRSSIYYYIKCVSQDALVDEEKVNPRCLWRMYQSTYEGIRANIELLMEQAYEKIIEDEQLLVGWNVS